jgi:hypothetical protein
MAVDLGWYLAPPLIAGFVTAIIGFYVLYKNPKDVATNVFFILMMACSIWMFGEFAMQVSGSIALASFFGKISNLGNIVLPIALLHFTLVYPTIAITRDKKLQYMAGLYIPAAVMIIILLFTNSFFVVLSTDVEYEPDLLIDGDGAATAGRGTADGPNGTFRKLVSSGQDDWYYYDINGNGKYDINETGSETLVYDRQGSLELIIVGRYGEDAGTRVPLENPEYRKVIYWRDSNGSDGGVVGEYDPGEDIYLDDNPLSGIQVVNKTDQVGVGTYRYQYRTLYPVFILFYFGVLILAVLSILSRQFMATDPKEKAQMSYLGIGLISIIFYILFTILLAYFIGPFMPGSVFDGILSLGLAMFFAVAVLKYNLMDIQLIIKKSLTYSLIFIFIAGTFVVIGELMEAAIGSVIMPGSESLIPNIISAIIVSVLFIPLTRQVRKFTDWLFPEARKYDREYRDRLTAYESTFEAVVSDGKISRKEKIALRILREKLDISEDEHKDIEDRLRGKVRSETGPDR